MQVNDNIPADNISLIQNSFWMYAEGRLITKPMELWNGTET